MSAPKTTPGPWRAQAFKASGPVGQVCVRVLDAGGVVVAEAFPQPYPVHISMPNAKLIAAAPDLADALAAYVADADVSLESLERVAEEFRRDTGYLAPGKSIPPGMDFGDYREKRRAAWNEWVAKRRREQLANGLAALSKAGWLP